MCGGGGGRDCLFMHKTYLVLRHVLMRPPFDFEFLRFGCEKMKNHGMCDYIPCI